MDIDRIATLKAAGLPSASIATIIGVSPSRIAQIEKQEDFLEIFSAKQAEAAAKDIEEISLSAKYTAAEHTLIDQMMQMAPVSELRDVTAALRVVAERQEKAKSRMNPILQQAPVLNNIIAIQLPAHALPEMILNSEKEVIAIGERNLTPLSSSGVLSLFSKLKNTNENKEHITDLSNLSDKGENNEPIRTLGSTEESSQEALSSQKLVNGAKRFLDSLKPVPTIMGY